MSEHDSEDVFEEDVRRLIESSVQATDADQDAAFEQNVVGSVLAEVAQARAAARAGRIRLIGRLAAAAVIVVAVGLLLHLSLDEQTETAKNSKVTRSPVEMLTAMSLNIAYRRGGMDAVEKQCDEAFRLLTPPPRSLSLEQLLAEFNGNGGKPERTKL
ncbi:MAG: hypothetical protein ACYTEL_16800 [Planctomycetota bacterium]|jgi:hypothetical protein